MKRGLLLIVPSGTLLVSCGGQEKEAAQEFCDCYEGFVDAQKKAGSAQNTADLFSAQSEMSQQLKDMETCLNDWKSKYDGKVDKDKSMEEIKAENADIYNILEEGGGL